MKQRQNEDECWTEKWLAKQGYQEIQRPRSDPPDFVVEGHYAVEVTRLSQRIVIGGAKTSISEEQAREPLRQCLEKTLHGLGPPGNEGRSWIIDCTYDLESPLPNPKAVFAQVRKALSPLVKPYDDEAVYGVHSRYRDHHKHAGEPFCLGFPHICLECGICLDLWEVFGSPSKFIVQDVSDGKGIHVAGELCESIRNRIHNKSVSIRDRDLVKKYATWWLVLVDYVCHAPVPQLAEHELSSLRNLNYDFWSRVVLLSSRNLDWYFDLLPIDR